MGRKEAEKECIKWINELDPSGVNGQMYTEMFKKMSDEDFDIWISQFGDNKFIPIYAPPNHPKIKIDLERNKSVAKKLGVKIFNYLVIKDNDLIYQPRHKYNLLMLPTKRSSQHIIKKLSVHEDLNSRNAVTGQVTGKSSAASLTQPEVNVLNSIGLHKTLEELLGPRAGDVKASLAMKNMLIRNGNIQMSDLKPFRDRTDSTKVLKSIFRAMHIDINL